MKNKIFYPIISFLFCVSISGSAIGKNHEVAKEIGVQSENDWKSFKAIEFTGEDLIWSGSVPYRIGEYEYQINFDLDNDGYTESLLFITDIKDNEEAWGIEFGKTKNSTGFVSERYLFPEKGDADNISELEFQLSLHDFDNDNIPEIIVTYGVDPEDFVDGKIFKLCGSGVELQNTKAYELCGWLREVGKFGSFYNDWYVNGNGLITRCQNGDYTTQVYYDSKLHNLAD